MWKFHNFISFRKLLTNVKTKRKNKKEILNRCILTSMKFDKMITYYFYLHSKL